MVFWSRISMGSDCLMERDHSHKNIFHHNLLFKSKPFESNTEANDQGCLQ